MWMTEITQPQFTGLGIPASKAEAGHCQLPHTIIEEAVRVTCHLGA